NVPPPISKRFFARLRGECKADRQISRINQRRSQAASHVTPGTSDPIGVAEGRGRNPTCGRDETGLATSLPSGKQKRLRSRKPLIQWGLDSVRRGAKPKALGH